MNRVQNRHCRRSIAFSFSFLGLLGLLGTSSALADSAAFRNIADDPAAGIDYGRGRSATYAVLEALQLQSLTQPFPFEALPGFPTRVHGIPGVAILDADGDGDLDLYVTNGPGIPNSLYASQLVETGALTFVDIAGLAGVEAIDQDSTGVCYGDVDNDSDPDLLVLGRSEPNRFFENLGGGTFAHIPNSGLEGGSFSSISCAFGDIDGDGLLDVTVANAFDFSINLAIFAEPFALNHPNELFRNRGGLGFDDVSDTSGIRSMAGLPPGAATITWSTAMVDVDRDGDIDILYADDQGAIPIARDGGLDRGFVRVMLNDGSGHFIDRPVTGTDIASGSWMGFGFGDVDCDGTIDILGSNFGDYNLPSFGAPYQLGDQATRVLYGHGDGTFRDPGVHSSLVSSAFGWGNAVLDYDNDGDQDLLYHGSLEMSFLAFVDNPGVLIENVDCAAGYRQVTEELGIDHLVRNVQGVAIGDLDRDHFPDIVSVANFRLPEALPLVPSPADYGGPLDAFASSSPLFFFDGTGFVWTGVELEAGDLAIEINRGRSAHGGHRGVTVVPVGAIGLTDHGRVNRSGIGAVVTFEPRGGVAVSSPIQGGSSLGSQHATEAYFGLARRPFGTVEVLWPGGVRNRLDRVRKSERVIFPEIPCSFDASWPNVYSYLQCVVPALGDLHRQDIIDSRTTWRFLASALRAYFDSQ